MRASLLFLALGLAVLAGRATGYTRPEEVKSLLHLRSELLRRGLAPYITTWHCPDENDLSTCDPCGKHSGKDNSWGYLFGGIAGGGWEHIACRKYDLSPAEFPGEESTVNVSDAGVVTNLHLADLRVPGDLASMEEFVCPFVHLREFDCDGSHFTGPLPFFLARCFPHLHELDLSYGLMSGVIPDWLPAMKTMDQFKIQYNKFSGTVPSVLGTMENLRIIWMFNNDLEGPLPDSFTNQNIASFDARFNRGLCGSIPGTLRAHIHVDKDAVRDNPPEPVPSSIHVDFPAVFAVDEAVRRRRTWYDQCSQDSENTTCGVLVTQGTRVGQPCA